MDTLVSPGVGSGQLDSTDSSTPYSLNLEGLNRKGIKGTNPTLSDAECFGV